MEREPEKIGCFIEKFIQGLEKKRKRYGERKKILQILEEKIRKDIGNHIIVGEIKRKKMVIEVDSPIWLYELSQRKEEILRVVKEVMGKKRVKDVILRVGNGK